MTMRFVPTTTIITSDGAIRYLFAWLDFMRTASPSGPGWTVPRSSNGTVGGAGDNIATFSDLSQYTAGVSESWFVLRSPDGAKEFLFFRVDATDANWRCRCSRGALFVGGDAGNIATATDQLLFIGTVAIATETENVLHMGADDAAPYGFFTYMHLTGAFASARGSMAWIPITDAVQPGDVDLYVLAYGITSVNAFDVGQLTIETDSNTISRCVGIPPGQAVQRTTPALTFRSQAGDMFPSDTPIDDNGDDLAMPVPFGVRSGISAPNGFKGFSDFVLWNGMARAAGETFASRTRVSWGDVNVPWDGSVPSDT